MRYSLDIPGVDFKAPNPGDAGYDIRSAQYVYISPKSQVKVSTGLHLEIPEGYVGIIKDRSSMAANRIYTHGGVIDSAYRGEIIVVLSNETEDPFTINVNDKIAQIVIVPYFTEVLERVQTLDLTGTARGNNGFGSTGV